ncbi:MAG: hypothetical protein AMJ95_02385 [Omnitrophica WOR_2 bacterium SM23_72]|nr:MAG: hypothetical protein AMJ95_02385 [Omnitrophica WOR_2 bacterium SM23_72]
MLKISTNTIKLKDNKSYCPVCLEVVESNIVERNGKIYLDIYCPNHGTFRKLHKWGNPKYYKSMNRPEIENMDRCPMALLIDTNYDCNQNCNFCYAHANERKEANPTIAEIIDQVENFRGIRIMLSGGEPTLREDLPIIIREIKKRKFIVTILSNGKKLVDKSYVNKLKKAGLDNVQLQLDSLDDSHCEFIRNEKLTDLKIKVVHNLKEAKISIDLFVPLIKGLNDNQIKNIITFAAQNSSVIKIVFFIPMWVEGRIIEHDSITSEEIIKILQSEYNMDEDAFMDYAKLDFLISLFYRRLTNKPFFKYQPCTVNYLFFYIQKSVIPLSEIIDLKKLNNFLECLCESLCEKAVFKKFFSLLRTTCLFSKEVLLCKKIRPFIFTLLRTLLSHIIFGTPPVIKDNYSFQVRVEGFFDRNNSDFRMFRHCNLRVNFQDESLAFCQSEIARKKYVK